MTQETASKRVIFISYSHADERWLRRLLVHLKPLALRYEVEIWSDVTIEAGDEWRAKIDGALGSASIFVLLLSADFVASDFIVKVEVPRLLDAARGKGAAVLPVVVRDFLMPGELREFQSVNRPEEPLEIMPEGRQEGVFKLVAARVVSLLDASAASPDSPVTPPDADAPAPPETDCRWYAQTFGAHIKRSRSEIILNYVLVAAATLIWVALVVAAFFFGQDLSVPRPFVAAGVVPCAGLAYFCMKKVIGIGLAVDQWTFMKGEFDSKCAAWSPVEFQKNVRRAENLLRSALGETEGGQHT
jgi:hypothetical protein